MSKPADVGIVMDELGQLSCQVSERSYQLLPRQVRILYALAESDHGQLSTTALCEVLFSLHKQSSRSQETVAEPAQLQQLSELLAPLVDQKLVTVSAPAPGALVQGHVVARGDAPFLITWLTRRWPGWPAYSREYDLFHY